MCSNLKIWQNIDKIQQEMDQKWRMCSSHKKKMKDCRRKKRRLKVEGDKRRS